MSESLSGVSHMSPFLAAEHTDPHGSVELELGDVLDLPGHADAQHPRWTVSRHKYESF
jgi:hypothetical protein